MQDVSVNRSLVYLRSRSYDPALGRFLQQDAAPVGNRYSYVGNNPASDVDPSGNCGLRECAGNALGFAQKEGGQFFDAVGACLDSAACTKTVGQIAFIAGALTGDPLLMGVGIGIMAGIDGPSCVGGSAWGCTDLAFDGAALVGVLRVPTPIDEGVYVVTSQDGRYVGQSGNIARRLQQWVASGRFTQEEVGAAERFRVTGGKTAREITEQLKIDELGGVRKLLNIRNPIGRARLDLMPKGYTR